MTSRFAVIELVLRQGSLAADVGTANAAGVKGIGIDAGGVDKLGVDEARRILDGEGIAVSSYVGLEPILRGDGTASLDETERRLEIAAALGAPGAVLVTGALGTRVPLEAEKLCREWLVSAGPLATSCGLRIMLEPIHPIMRRLSFVHTLAHGLALVDGIDGAGVVLDVGHVWWEPGVDDLIREHMADIVSVQLTNVDSVALDELRYERSQLDSGQVPVAAFIELLEKSGYRGWYENEVLVRTPRDERLDLLRRSREWFDALGVR
ncbi:MAG: sugar phosphate isomerase/epimerase [Acidimicrobiia bacterium]|nr:sugar phosphate isomerase/epimerase [Acidimicrobiia bacterium]